MAQRTYNAALQPYQKNGLLPAFIFFIFFFSSTPLFISLFMYMYIFLFLQNLFSFLYYYFVILSVKYIPRKKLVGCQSEIRTPDSIFPLATKLVDLLDSVNRPANPAAFPIKRCNTGIPLLSLHHAICIRMYYFINLVNPPYMSVVC